MEYVNVAIVDMEMYVPVNDKLGDLILLAQRRLNYQKHIAKMRKACKGKIESEVVVMDSDFFYALEDVLEEEGYDSIVHHQLEKSPIEQSKVLYALFREDKTMRSLIFVCGYEQEQIQNIIRNFFEALKKIIF